MAVSLYFGLPGCGKTTHLAYQAKKAVRSKRYKNVYTNVRIKVPGVTYIDNECIGVYDLSDCLLLIDEATLFADSRAYKSFDRSKLEYFLTHRHYNADICLYTQQWDGVDRKIRVITDRVYYIYKGFFTGWLYSSYYRIPYGIIIPDPKKAGEKLGEIVQGYCKPNFLVRLFAPKLFRPLYYKYFDSWERTPLPPLPEQYKPVPERPPKFNFVALRGRFSADLQNRYFQGGFWLFAYPLYNHYYNGLYNRIYNRIQLVYLLSICVSRHFIFIKNDLFLQKTLQSAP